MWDTKYNNVDSNVTNVVRDRTELSELVPVRSGPVELSKG